MTFELEQLGKTLASSRIHDALKAVKGEALHCRTLRDEPAAYGVQACGTQAEGNVSATTAYGSPVQFPEKKDISTLYSCPAASERRIARNNILVRSERGCRKDLR